MYALDKNVNIKHRCIYLYYIMYVTHCDGIVSGYLSKDLNFSFPNLGTYGGLRFLRRCFILSKYSTRQTAMLA